MITNAPTSFSRREIIQLPTGRSCFVLSPVKFAELDRSCINNGFESKNFCFHSFPYTYRYVSFGLNLFLVKTGHVSQLHKIKSCNRHFTCLQRLLEEALTVVRF